MLDRPAPNAMRGVLLVTAAVFIFAAMDTNGKFLFARYAVPLVLTIRYIVNLILVVAVFGPQQGRAMFSINRKVLVWLRALSLCCGSLFAGLALKSMPVAETVAIIYLAPFGVLLVSGPLLGEKVKLSAWLATALGFVGLLLIVRPSAGLSSTGVTYALLCAAVTVVYHSFSRLLAKTETTAALLFYTALAGTIFFGVMLPWDWQMPQPSTIDVVLLLATGVMSLVGHFMFTAAYREAPASLLTPVNYMHLAWAALMGWIVFDHIPDGWTMIGIGLVAAAGTGNALWNHFKSSSDAAVEPEEV
jgi:drug/metabolite transporter (DMT)-like permease